MNGKSSLRKGLEVNRAMGLEGNEVSIGLRKGKFRSIGFWQPSKHVCALKSGSDLSGWHPQFLIS